MLVQRQEHVAGSERYLLSVLPAFVQRGIEVSYLMIRAPESNAALEGFLEELRRSGVKTHVVVSRSPLSPQLIWRIREILRAEKIDVLQTNLLHADVYGALVKRTMADPPVLVSAKHGYEEAFQIAHGFDPTRLRWDLYSAATWFAARSADAVFTISRGLAHLHAVGGLVAPEKLRVIPYGFDFGRQERTTAPGACRFATKQIVVISRLVPYKQVNVPIEAMPSLLRDFPDLKLVVLGIGPLRDELEALSRRLGVADKVMLAGFHENVHDFLEDSDIFVLPSSAEGFGRVLMEAWWHRKPVVCFDVPAPNQIVTHEENGLLVPLDEEGAFAKALWRLLADPDEARRLGENGRRTLETDYTLDVMVDRSLALYRELLESK
jgi:glycosyltransferase involved in cell wall biosynthesis